MPDDNSEDVVVSSITNIASGGYVHCGTATGRFPPSRLPPHVAFTTENTESLRQERNALRLCLIIQARMLASWAPECFPAGPDGKVHFARALMEAAAQEMSEAAKVPYPVPDADPPSNPTAGAIKTLERVQLSLTNLDGVRATHTDPLRSSKAWRVDVGWELTEVGALLESLRTLATPPEQA